MGVITAGSVGAIVGWIAEVGGGVSNGWGVGLGGGGTGLSTKTDGKVGVGGGPGWHAPKSIIADNPASPVNFRKKHRPLVVRAVPD